MNRPGGGLPVVHGVQGGLGAQTRERTYERWNVANNLIGKRWSELSAVINGPDIMLRPRWKSETHTHIEWVFMHGVEEYPVHRTEVHAGLRHNRARRSRH